MDAAEAARSSAGSGKGGQLDSKKKPKNQQTNSSEDDEDDYIYYSALYRVWDEERSEVWPPTSDPQLTEVLQATTLIHIQILFSLATATATATSLDHQF